MAYDSGFIGEMRKEIFLVLSPEEGQTFQRLYKNIVESVYLWPGIGISARPDNQIVLEVLPGCESTDVLQSQLNTGLLRIQDILNKEGICYGVRQGQKYGIIKWEDRHLGDEPPTALPGTPSQHDK